MIRGKLPTERNLVPRLPSIQNSGILSRLKPGEKVLLELEVVTSESVANSYVDFVSLSTDVNFSGMFKAKTVAIGSGVEGSSIKSKVFKRPPKLPSNVIKEFDLWADEGNVPMNVSFDRRALMNCFKERVPEFADEIQLSHVCSLLTSFANRIGYHHNSKIHGKNAYSLLTSQ
ncbi:hypothetical protein L0657_06700 [Dyadobacter sp. CY345]|uniref:hypothetical protein n=1 Tax=Dyadobacter sp. CY345 TaxID=2909335 RepID=UPI001F24AE89|nr:hypothetical protein [Dyadobacter sp. CY345]MCF2443639.1 hypothetical protein [Dyadobacter sp. CY345]